MNQVIDLYSQDRPAPHPRIDQLIVDLVTRSRPPSVICRELAGLGWRPGDVLARVLFFMTAQPQDGGLDPSTRACVVLWGRGCQDVTSPTGWRLDGRPVPVTSIFQAANVVLRTMGHTPIHYPGVV